MKIELKENILKPYITEIKNNEVVINFFSDNENISFKPNLHILISELPENIKILLKNVLTK